MAANDCHIARTAIMHCTSLSIALLSPLLFIVHRIMRALKTTATAMQVDCLLKWMSGAIQLMVMRIMQNHVHDGDEGR